MHAWKLPRRLHFRGAIIPTCYLQRQALISRTYYIPAFSPRPNTLWAKLWYQRNGTPRSKRKGFVYASLLGLTTYGFIGLCSLVWELEDQNAALAAIVRLRLSSDKIFSADLSTLDGSVSCFRLILLETFDGVYKPVFDQFFVHLLRNIQSEDCPAERRQHLHEAIRLSCEKVRDALKEIERRKHPLEEVALTIYDMVPDQFAEISNYFIDGLSQKERAEISKYVTLGRSGKHIF